MAYVSLTQQVKEIETRIGTILSIQDLDSLSLGERELFGAIKHSATDTRLAVRDYEYADTRASQLEHAKEGRQYLQVLQRHIVKASEANIFSPVDVAQLTAQLEGVLTELT